MGNLTLAAKQKKSPAMVVLLGTTAGLSRSNKKMSPSLF